MSIFSKGLLLGQLLIGTWAAGMGLPAHLINTSERPWFLVPLRGSHPVQLRLLESNGRLTSLAYGSEGSSKAEVGTILLPQGAGLSLALAADDEAYFEFRVLDYRGREVDPTAPSPLGWIGSPTGITVRQTGGFTPATLCEFHLEGPFLDLGAQGTVLGIQADDWGAMATRQGDLPISGEAAPDDYLEDLPSSPELGPWLDIAAVPFVDLLDLNGAPVGFHELDGLD